MPITTNYDDAIRKDDYGYPTDWLCIPLAKLIEKEGKLSLNQIIERSGLARQTTHTHLKHLVRDGILSREVVCRGRGRPTFFYFRTERPIKSLKLEIVSLPFAKLESVCRYRKNIRCQLKDTFCSIDECSITLK